MVFVQADSSLVREPGLNKPAASLEIRMGFLKELARHIPGVRPAYLRVRLQRERLRLRSLGRKAAFEEIFLSNGWQGKESMSGHGSDTESTRRLVEALPPLMKQFQVATLLDIPCGDFHWMKDVDLTGTKYIGADIVLQLVEDCSRRYGSETRMFCTLDLTESPLPDCDLILCRDCLVHLSFRDVMRALDNICRSNLTFMLTTTFPRKGPNHDIVTGEWRPLNLELSPFGFPAPLALLTENDIGDGGPFSDKALGLWRVTDVAAALQDRRSA